MRRFLRNVVLALVCSLSLALSPRLLAAAEGAGLHGAAEETAAPGLETQGPVPDGKSVLGRGQRIAGVSMVSAGAALTIGVGILATVELRRGLTGCEEEGFAGIFCPMVYMVGTGVLITLISAGFVVQGIGSKLWANGNARDRLGDSKASGTPGLYWLGWTLTAAGVILPLVALGADEPELAALGGWLPGLGATAVFALGPQSESGPQVAVTPVALHTSSTNTTGLLLGISGSF